MAIPKGYCRHQGKKCKHLRVEFPFATCKKTAAYNDGTFETGISMLQDQKEDIIKPDWCTKK